MRAMSKASIKTPAMSTIRIELFIAFSSAAMGAVLLVPVLWRFQRVAAQPRRNRRRQYGTSGEVPAQKRRRHVAVTKIEGPLVPRTCADRSGATGATRT